MKAETLRKSILQYAIHGKLVPQIDTDEPACVLLEKIKKEKTELIKQGNIKAEKPLPPISDDEKPFEIPESWEWVRLGEAFITIMGQSPIGTSVNVGGNGIEFHQGKVFFAKEVIGRSNKTSSQPSKIAKENSVLLCVRAPVGKVNITNRKICIGRGLCAVEMLLKIDFKFTFYWLLAYEQIFINQATGTTFVAITVDIVNKQPIPFPPLEEQKRIVARIEELMTLVDDYEKNQIQLEKLEKEFPEKLKKSILQYAIQGKLVAQVDADEPASVLLEKIKKEKAELVKQGKIKAEKPLPPISDDEKPFEIPESWEWVRLGEIGT